MALRLIEIYHREGKADDIDFILQDLPVLETWHYHMPESNESVSKILVKIDLTESVLDKLSEFCKNTQEMRIVIMPVEATLPRPDEPEEEPDTEIMQEKIPQRISTEELYQKMNNVSGISKQYIIMAVLSSFVAAIGLLNNDVAVIIGSMVIAPLLSPNMALSLATTLADYELGKKSIITNIAGFSIVLSIGVVMGLIMDVDPALPQIAARSDVSHFYIILALAAGVAGAYSITTGVAEALVGVMVAVALLPPLVAAGLLFGSGYLIKGSGALLLCIVNVVCINLSGVVTFLIEGIQPKKWLDAERAKKSSTIAVAAWITILIILAILIFLAQKF